MQPLETPGTNPNAHRPEGAFQVSVQGRSLEVKRIPSRIPHAPELVFLHEGLGSVSHWKDFPERLTARDRKIREPVRREQITRELFRWEQTTARRRLTSCRTTLGAEPV